MHILERVRDKIDRFTMSDYENEEESDIYLNYHGAQLTWDDYGVLQNPDEWLMDQHIFFWQKYLIHEELAKHPSSRVIFVPPAISVMINEHFSPTEIPYINEASHIFLPINDGSGAHQDGGSHWSLLVISTHDRRAFHYDSSGSMLAHHARRLCRVISGWFGYDITFRDLPETPQQTDGSACGVFICWAMKHLLVRRLLAVESDHVVDMSLGAKNVNLKEVRMEMRELVFNLRRNACRSIQTEKRPPTRS